MQSLKDQDASQKQPSWPHMGPCVADQLPKGRPSSTPPGWLGPHKVEQDTVTQPAVPNCPPHGLPPGHHGGPGGCGSPGAEDGCGHVRCPQDEPEDEGRRVKEASAGMPPPGQAAGPPEKPHPGQ